MKPKEKPHYVSNRDFSNAVVAYCTDVKESKESGIERPIVTNYIATCFLKIAEGLSHKGNFVRYTYREEMVMDAVENCLKAIENYDIEAATRSGKPNAFAYFTQISWYAFLRRIQKEKKQQDEELERIRAEEEANRAPERFSRIRASVSRMVQHQSSDNRSVTSLPTPRQGKGWRFFWQRDGNAAQSRRSSHESGIHGLDANRNARLQSLSERRKIWDTRTI